MERPIRKRLLGEGHDGMVVVYDPGLSSLNLGDEIISDSALRYIQPVLEWRTVAHLSSHQPTSFRFRRRITGNGVGFVLGSNLLQNRGFFSLHRNWEVSLLDGLQIGNLVLVGCGWSSYTSRNVGLYSKLFYKRLLSSEYLHSVRDEYSKRMLIEAGVTNVVNTGCATLWGLTKEHCAMIRRSKGEIAVTTITDYRQDMARDTEMMRILAEQYAQVHVWPQGSRDFEYLSRLGLLDSVRLIEPSLKSYDDFMRSHPEADYVGTRLHGGIRALQHGNRSIIVSIDNRAREMGRDFKLPAIERESIGTLSLKVNEPFATAIAIDEDAIKSFLRSLDSISDTLPRMAGGVVE